ncbi:hypothetical protein [Algoriphagus chordae]|uniref:Uncharacterized protein n=1 Tax=Algoriphagus chordae TaxID=237019 RepID=A0A2W7QQ44_9BACT|nr:hypothetical protein [Algoriphagus chordae]PZX50121.1 hypothetical protein LV85_02737 [Algoriphagus chordae]
MKNLSKEEEYIRQYITELGTEAPTTGFHKTILAKLKPKRSVSVYSPVISALAWKIIGAVIAVLVISVLLFLPSGQNTIPLIDQLSAIPIPQVTVSLPQISFPKINLSLITIQALVVFSLLAAVTVITTFKKWKVS